MRGAQLIPTGRHRLTEAIKCNVSLHISLSNSHPHIHPLHSLFPSLFPLYLSLSQSVHHFLPPVLLHIFFSPFSPFSLFSAHKCQFILHCLSFLLTRLHLHLPCIHSSIFTHHYTCLQIRTKGHICSLLVSL